ncbi:MAG: hypothetical protein EP338_10915 [Bacteroidetes bacterium]|nr:MAG: hypothetical protein EP338_10915 [Bacteroidota bacterium]
MAGGKETPRQKMIGMMYLVLTALLALNVSKSILDAFVAIEENTQKANVAQYERGKGFIGEVRSELSSTPNNAENKAKRAKLEAVLKQMDEVDKITAVMIQEIDKIKLDILEKSGEAVKEYKEKSEEHVLWKPYKKEESCLPIRMNLMAVQAKDQYDVPMHEIIGEDIKSPNGSGKKLWADFLKYRDDMVKTLGTYKFGEKTFTFKPSAPINQFESNADLVQKVKKMVESNKTANLKEDQNVLADIYINLTKPERLKVHDLEGVHWIGATFDHAPLVAAVASLSSMEQDVLSARAMALAHLKGKVSTGEYSFNKIMPLAYGPLIANSGEEVEVQVMMAAFDSDNQPSVTYGGNKVPDVKDGYGTVKAKVAGSGEMVMSGTVAIRNKSGVEKKENWTHTIKIMKPEGTVSLPEMNMMYRGYDNKVEGVASGYDQTVLTGSNVSLTKSGKGYIGKPGKGKTCTVTISGKNTVTNKTVSLGVFTFRVSNLPPAKIYFGNASDGSKGSKFETKLFTKYPPEIPLNVSFQTLSWEMSFMGRSVKGVGSRLDAKAQALLKQAKPGSDVSFIVKYKGPDNVQRTGVCVVKL